MKYYTVKPTGKLADYVRYFWVLESSVSKEQPYIHRTLASFCPEIIFHYRGPFEELTYDGQHEKSFLTGVHAQTTRFRRFIVKEDFGIFGVLLQPYAVSALFGIPSFEITNELPDLFTLLGQQGKDIEEQMVLAKDNRQRLELINAFLEQRLVAVTRPDIINAVQAIYDRKGRINFKEFAGEFCLSQRQFERKFKEFVGFSPKLFSRIVRFKSLLCHQDNTEQRTLTQVAYDFGYYDQAHFIQDFKAFSGYNPKAYFSGKAGEVFYAP